LGRKDVFGHWSEESLEPFIGSGVGEVSGENFEGGRFLVRHAVFVDRGGLGVRHDDGR